MTSTAPTATTGPWKTALIVVASLVVSLGSLAAFLAIGLLQGPREVEDFVAGSSEPLCFAVAPGLYLLQIPVVPLGDAAYIGHLELASATDLTLEGAGLLGAGEAAFSETEPPDSSDAGLLTPDVDGSVFLNQEVTSEGQELLVLVEQLVGADPASAAGVSFANRAEVSTIEVLAMDIRIAGSTCTVSFAASNEKP